MRTLIYKILRPSESAQAQAAGMFAGSADDERDGFIHLSTREQLRGTIERHFAGERDLIVLEIDASALGDALKWEPSRGGALFPHLYAELPLDAIVRRLTPAEIEMPRSS
jgi:uncharacterized protein (DUF952 family)